MWPNQVLLQARTHTPVCVCALRNNKAQGFTQGSTDTQRFGRPPACVAEFINAELHRGSRFTTVGPTQFCWEHTHVCCRTDEFSVAPKGQRLQQKVWPTSCCCEHTNVCCRVCHFKIAPKGQRVTRVWRAAARTHCEGTCVLQNRSIKDCTRGSRVTNAAVGTHTCVLQRGGRPNAAVSIHVCVCGRIDQGVHMCAAD